MNQRVIETAIANHLPDSKKGDHEIQLESREYLEKICQNIVHLPLVARPSELLRELLDGLDERDQVCRVVAENDCLPQNARQIKAFANVLRRNARRLPQLDEPERRAQITVALTYLYRFHPDLYRLLDSYRHPFYEELRLWCDGQRKDTENLHPMIKRLLPYWEVEKPPESAPVLDTRIGSRTFADPVKGGVMRAQKLIANLKLTASEIDDFLLF